MNKLQTHRLFFAKLITATVGIPETEQKLIQAFASTPRENFVGQGPWQVFTPVGYIQTPSDNPIFLYQDIVVALKGEEKINNGQPSLHAACLAVLGIREGETIVHIGAGTGYYSALLSQLTGSKGSVLAYEINEDLAKQATKNLAEYPNVSVYNRSGSEGEIPACDIIYVNAGATAPLDIWLDALKPKGRLLFPLTPNQGGGAMLLITRTINNNFMAQFVCGAMFIPCVGARDDETAQKLLEAFMRGNMAQVRSLHRSTTPDSTVWCSTSNWWLSTSPVE